MNIFMVDLKVGGSVPLKESGTYSLGLLILEGEGEVNITGTSYKSKVFVLRGEPLD